jgi:hypothetical protein
MVGSMLIKKIILMSCFLFVSNYLLSGGPDNTKLIYHGKLNFPSWIIPGKIFSEAKHTLVFKNGKGHCLEFYELVDNYIYHTIKKTKNLELSKNEIVSQAILSDINKDNKDEIIVCLDDNKTIRTYYWDVDNFRNTDITIPDFKDGLIVGDINNDGQNDIIFTSRENDPSYNEGYEEDIPLRLNIWTFNKSINKFELLWCDNGQLEFKSYFHSPSLSCVADVDGSGINRIITKQDFSDVSPWAFSFLVWKEDKIEYEQRDLSFTGRNILNTSALKENIDNLAQLFIYNIDFLNKNDHEFVVADISKTIGLNPFFKKVTGKIEGDTFLILNLYNKTDMLAPKTYKLNLDGKGVGTFEIDEEVKQWRFYR